MIMEELLSVEEATSAVYSSLEEFTGWKYSKTLGPERTVWDEEANEAMKETIKKEEKKK